MSEVKQHKATGATLGNPLYVDTAGKRIGHYSGAVFAAGMATFSVPFQLGAPATFTPASAGDASFSDGTRACEWNATTGVFTVRDNANSSSLNWDPSVPSLVLGRLGSPVTVRSPDSGVAGTAGAPFNLGSGAGNGSADGGALGIVTGASGLGAGTSGALNMDVGVGATLGGAITLGAANAATITIGHATGLVSCPGSAASSQRIGVGADASGANSVAIGDGSTALQNCVAVGQGAVCIAAAAVAVGQNTTASSNGVAIGRSANAGPGIAIGANASAVNTTIAIGFSTTATVENSTAVGYQADSAQRAVALGASAQAVQQDAIAIGYAANVSGTRAISIGSLSSAATQEVVIGYFSKGGTGNCVVIGAQASAVGFNRAVVVGYASTVTGTGGIAIGHGATAGAHQCGIGGGGLFSYIDDLAFGLGPSSADTVGAADKVFRVTDYSGVGANISGFGLRLRPGKGTGGNVSALTVQTYDSKPSGATPHDTLVTRLSVDTNAITIGGGTENVTLAAAAGQAGFFGSAGAVKGAVTGSRGGNAALASLLTLLAAHGLLTDSSTA